MPHVIRTALTRVRLNDFWLNVWIGSLLSLKLVSRAFESKLDFAGCKPQCTRVAIDEFRKLLFENLELKDTNSARFSQFLPEHPIEAERGRRGIGIRMGGRQRMIDALLYLSGTYPRSSPRIINSALRATASKSVVRPCFEALNLGSPNGLRLTASEYGVGINHCIEAAEDVSEAFQGLASETGSHVLSPFALRFVRRSSGLMSPMFGRDTCMLEMPLLDGLSNRENFLQLFWETLAPHNARPHWGQRNNVDASRAHRLFPRFSDFQRKVSEINPGKLFESEFTRTLGLNGQRDSELHFAGEATYRPLRQAVG
jgi:hypothetical protein